MVAPCVLIVDDNQIFGSQVVAAFADAGISATCVARGNDALALLQSEATPPDLLIVDLVRPASGGRWLLERISAQPALALVPVLGTFYDLPEGVEVQVKPIFPSQVVASARRLIGLDPAPPQTEAAADVAVHAAPPATDPEVELDPFEDHSDFGPADTLLAPSNIEELARVLASGSNPAVSLEIELLECSEGTSSDELKAAPVEAPMAEMGSLRTPLRSRTLPQFNALPPRASRSSDNSQPSIALPPSTPDALPARPSEPPPLPSSNMLSPGGAALAGDLAVVPLIDVISMLARQRQSGMLRVVTEFEGSPTEPLNELTIAWRDGRIDLCTASGPAKEDLRIGRFLREAAAISATQIDEIVARRQAHHLEDHLLGLLLCQEGYIDQDALRQALAHQTAELIYSALRIKHGRFFFDHLAAPPPHAASSELGGSLGLDAETLLLEGYRRIRDFAYIQKDADEDAVYIGQGAATGSGVGLERLGLSNAEIIVLGLCNGRLSLAEIAQESHMSLLDVGRTVRRLQALQLCRRRLPALLAS